MKVTDKTSSCISIFLFWQWCCDEKQIQKTMKACVSVLVFSSVELTDGDGGTNSRPEAETGEERSVEMRVNATDLLGLTVWHSIESQHPGLLVQVNPDTPGFGSSQCSFFPSMPHRESLAGPVQAPGPGVVAQSGAVLGCRALHVFIRHADSHLNTEESQLTLEPVKSCRGRYVYMRFRVHKHFCATVLF